ncbi:hypothetical protein VpasPP24_49 [Vibrio phage Vpas_PP24]|nr:hypothetical protein VpasPP24_49 [Vibrio phage Vpas_PP24]
MQLIEAENVLGISVLEKGVTCPNQDVSLVGRLYLGGGEIEPIGDALNRTNKSIEQFISDGRKAIIRVAMLYHRFNKEIHKPDAFALAYSDGKYDRIPDHVVNIIRPIILDTKVDPRIITTVSNNSFIIGDIKVNHIELHRVDAETGTYRATVHDGDLKPMSLEITKVTTPTPAWWY